MRARSARDHHHREVDERGREGGHEAALAVARHAGHVPRVANPAEQRARFVDHRGVHRELVDDRAENGAMLTARPPGSVERVLEDHRADALCEELSREALAVAEAFFARRREQDAHRSGVAGGRPDLDGRRAALLGHRRGRGALEGGETQLPTRHRFRGTGRPHHDIACGSRGRERADRFDDVLERRAIAETIAVENTETERVRERMVRERMKHAATLQPCARGSGRETVSASSRIRHENSVSGETPSPRSRGCRERARGRPHRGGGRPGRDGAHAPRPKCLLPSFILQCIGRACAAPCWPVDRARRPPCPAVADRGGVCREQERRRRTGRRQRHDRPRPDAGQRRRREGQRRRGRRREAAAPERLQARRPDRQSRCHAGLRRLRAADDGTPGDDRRHPQRQLPRRQGHGLPPVRVGRRRRPEEVDRHHQRVGPCSVERTTASISRPTS